jgi:hypothetical protein
VSAQVTREHIVALLRRAGLGAQAEDITADLPDPVDIDQATAHLASYGINKDQLMSLLGGSP